VEEELDNFRHWHEAELPDLQARCQRLKEIEPEYEEVCVGVCVCVCVE
jgi:hypothetical protein